MPNVFWLIRQSSHCFWNYAIHALSTLIKRLCSWLFRKATRGQVKQHLIQGVKSWRNSVLFQQTGCYDIFSHVRLNIDVKRNVSQHVYLKLKFRTQSLVSFLKPKIVVVGEPKVFPLIETKSHQAKLRVIFLIILELNKTVSFETCPNITVICKQ